MLRVFLCSFPVLATQGAEHVVSKIASTIGDNEHGGCAPSQVQT